MEQPPLLGSLPIGVASSLGRQEQGEPAGRERSSADRCTAEPRRSVTVVNGEDAAAKLARACTDLAAATAHAEELQRALLSSRPIGMAMGILMERHRLTVEQAFDCLRDLSQRRNVKVRDLAEQLIYTGNAEQGHD